MKGVKEDGEEKLFGASGVLTALLVSKGSKRPLSEYNTFLRRSRFLEKEKP